MKKGLALLLSVILLTVSFVVPVSALDDEVIDGGYYVVFDDYRQTINEKYRLFQMSANRWEIHDITLHTTDKVKIAYSSDGMTVDALYPAGEDDWYIPAYNSVFYTLAFDPTGNSGGTTGDKEWFMGTIKAWPCEPPEHTELTPQRYVDSFASFLPNWREKCTYDEVYYHYPDGDRWNPDWALIRADAVIPEGFTAALPMHAVFDEIIAFHRGFYVNGEPNRYFGFFVYDVSQDTFYDIKDAWEMDFDDLHDVFVTYEQAYDDCSPLGDADCDGDLTIIDVTKLQRFLAGLDELIGDSLGLQHTECAYDRCIDYYSDFDCDGERTIIDATLIQRHLVGNTRYPHSFTAYAHMGQSGTMTLVQAASSYGSEPVQYCYTIYGGVTADSADSGNGDDYGDFSCFGPAYEPLPGEFRITTDFYKKSEVQIPNTALTYGGAYTLVVTAKTSGGKVSKPVVIEFNNVY